MRDFSDPTAAKDPQDGSNIRHPSGPRLRGRFPSSTEKLHLRGIHTPAREKKKSLSMGESQQTTASNMNRLIRPSLDAIFKKNKEWVATKTNGDPAFFDKLSAGQSPDYLSVSHLRSHRECKVCLQPIDTLAVATAGCLQMKSWAWKLGRFLFTGTSPIWSRMST